METRVFQFGNIVLEISQSDGCYDFTAYELPGMVQVDGGQLDSVEINMNDAAIEAMKMLDMEEQLNNSTVVFTHTVAADIVEMFDDLLCEKEISVPCDDLDEQMDRYDDGNEAGLYGMEYAGLSEQVEEYLISLLDKAGVPYKADVYEGGRI